MANSPVSPKVFAGAATAGLVGLALQLSDKLSPDLFAGLGDWQGPVFFLVTTLLSVLAAWWKTDPLRLNPEDQPAAPASEPSAPASQPAATPASLTGKHAADPVAGSEPIATTLV